MTTKFTGYERKLKQVARRNSLWNALDLGAASFVLIVFVTMMAIAAGGGCQ
jgi:hypothetical protein